MTGLLPRDGRYRRLFSAHVVELVGSGLTTVALGLLAYDGAGAGAALVRAFEAQARMIGCATARLVTFGEDGSSGAGAFYERIGWRFGGSRTDDAGRTVLTYERTL